MLRSTKELFDYDILATDGEIGEVEDFYFSDSDWIVRYLVADTGPWILGRKVLILASELREPDWNRETFPVDLTREQVKNSPDVMKHKPVSQQEMINLHDYYHWPVFWAPLSGPAIPGLRSVAASTTKVEPEAATVEAVKVAEEQQQASEFVLRAAREVIGYQVDGSDDELGKIDDLILDDADWMIRYVVLDTKDKKVLIAPQWIAEIDHKKASVSTNLGQEAISESPAYDPDTPINRRYEEVLYDFHGRPYYWPERN